MTYINGTNTALTSIEQALARRLPYWELILTDWGYQNLSYPNLPEDLFNAWHTVNLEFPPERDGGALSMVGQETKIPAVRAIAISPESDVDRVRVSIIPTSTDALRLQPTYPPSGTTNPFAAVFPDVLLPFETEVSVERPWIAPAYTALNQIRLRAAPGTCYTNNYWKYGSSSALPTAWSPRANLKVLFYFRDVPIIAGKRAPLLSRGQYVADTAGLDTTSQPTLTAAISTPTEQLVKTIPIMGRKKVRVSVRPDSSGAGQDVNVRICGAYASYIATSFGVGQTSLYGVEHQFMASTVATYTAPLTRYIDNSPQFPFLNIYSINVSPTAQVGINVIVDAED